MFLPGFFDSAPDKNKIGLVDADLLDGGTNFPNLALMKISGYYKSRGYNVELLDQFEPTIDRVFVCKVFQKTRVPDFVSDFKNVSFGGTGFNLYNAEPLPYEIEHVKPDYSIYEQYIKAHAAEGGSRRRFNEYYTDASIGFTTRGCVRRCAFCVNRNKTHVERWSPVGEFLDASKKYIVLLDDNILAYNRWAEVFDELETADKPIRFIQGLDVRLMTKDKATRINSIKYHRSICFAFDNINDAAIVERGLSLYRENCQHRQTLAYVLTGFYKQGEPELIDALERIEILTRYNVDPYIMKHERFKKDPFCSIYTELARWANQPQFRKQTFGDFFAINASKKARVQSERLSPRTKRRLFNICRFQYESKH